MTGPESAALVASPGLVIDCFAGPGGWDEGVLPLGLRPVGIEWDHAACKTATHAGHTRVRADVETFPLDHLKDRVTGLIMSPPCQDFSLAGKQAGIEGEKGRLITQVLRWTNELRPRWLACEQVPPCLPLWEEYAITLREWGYKTWAGILNSADYGVPQTRRRAILLASLDRQPERPEPTHAQYPEVGDLFGGYRLGWVSMATALGWQQPAFIKRERSGDRAEEGFQAEEMPSQTLTSKTRSWVVRTGNNSMVTGRTGSRAGDGDVQPYERSLDEPAPTVDTMAGSKWTVKWDGPGGIDPDGPATTVTGDPRLTARSHHGPGEQGRNAVPSERVRAWYEDRPATTVVGSFSPDVIAAPGYRTEVSRQNAEGSVKVTIEEAGILQSFRRDYPWQGSRSKQFQQVGNAIPPRLALHVVAEVLGVQVPLATEAEAAA